MKTKEALEFDSVITTLNIAKYMAIVEGRKTHNAVRTACRNLSRTCESDRIRAILINMQQHKSPTNRLDELTEALS